MKARNIAQVLVQTVAQVSAFCRRPVLTGFKWEGILDRLVAWPQEVLRLNLPRQLARLLVPATRGEPQSWATIEGLEPRVLMNALYWDADPTTPALDAGSGTWSVGSDNWRDEYGNPETWDNEDIAFFATSGTSVITVSGAVQAAGLTISGTGYSFTGSTDDTLAFTSGGTITTSETTTMGVTISGSVGLTKAGTATLTLLGTHSYTGGTTVSAGTLQLGDGTSGHDGTITGSITVGSTASLVFKPSGSQTFSNTISGAGTVQKTGGGTLVLSGSNTFSGGTTLAAGLLEVGHARALGQVNTYCAGPLMVSGGTLDLHGYNITFWPLSGTGGTITNLAAAESNLGIYQPTDYQTSYTIGTSLAGNLAITRYGSGCTTITGQNSYTGVLKTFGGIWRVGADADQTPFGAGRVRLEGGELDLYGHDITLTSFDDIGGYIVNRLWSKTAVLTVANEGNIKFTGRLVDAEGRVGLNKVGAGTLVLTGTSSCTGGTTVSAGTLQLGDGTSGHDGTITGSITIGTSATLAFKTFGSPTFANVLTGGGSVSKGGPGTVVLQGANTYQGGTRLTEGFLQANHASAFGSINGNSPTLTVAGGTLDLHGYGFTFLDVNSTGGTITNTAAGSPVAFAIYQPAGDSSCTLAGRISGNLTVVRYGSGVTWITGENTYTGLTVLYGGTWRPESSSALGSGSLTVAGGELDLYGNRNISVKYITNISGYILNRQYGTTGTLTIANDDNVCYPGRIVEPLGLGHMALNKAGSGIATFTLGGSNTYTGGTTLTSGVLSINSDANIGGSNTPLVFAGGTLQITGGSLHDLDSHPVNWSTFNGGLDIAEAGNTFTVSQALSGSGSLVKSGSGTLVLTGTSSYTGGTTVSAGTVQLGDGTSGHDGTITGSITISANATLGLKPYGSQSYENTFSGAGILRKAGAGTATLSASSSFAGTVAVDAGSLVVAAVQATFGTLAVGAAGYAALSSGSNKLLSLTHLSIESGGLLELADNGLAVADTSLFSTLQSWESAVSPRLISSLGPGNPASDQTAGIFLNQGTPLPVTNFYGVTLTTPALLLQALPAVTSLTWSQGGPTSLDTLQAVVQFNQPVTGVIADAFALQCWPTDQGGSLPDAAITNITGSGSTYTLTVSTGAPSSNGTLSLVLSDNAGSIGSSGSIGLGYNPAIGGKGMATGTLVVDKPPVVTDITLLNPVLSSQDVVGFQVTFSEAVSGMEASQLALLGTISDGSIRTVVPADETNCVYTVLVNSGTGSGSLALSVSGTAIVDLDPEGLPDDAFAGPANSAYYAFAARTVSNLEAQAVSSDQVNLTWDNSVADDMPLEVFYKVTNGGTYQSAGTLTGDINHSAVTGLDPQTQYTFQIQTLPQRNGSSTQSNEASATTLASRDLAPITDLDADYFYNNSNGSVQISLTWTDDAPVDANNQTVPSYAVELKLGSVGNFRVPADWSNLHANVEEGRTKTLILNLNDAYGGARGAIDLLGVALTFRVARNWEDRWVYSAPAETQVPLTSDNSNLSVTIFRTTVEDNENSVDAYYLGVYPTGALTPTLMQTVLDYWSSHPQYVLQFQFPELEPQANRWISGTGDDVIKMNIPAWDHVNVRILDLINRTYSNPLAIGVADLGANFPITPETKGTITSTDGPTDARVTWIGDRWLMSWTDPNPATGSGVYHCNYIFDVAHSDPHWTTVSAGQNSATVGFNSLFGLDYYYFVGKVTGDSFNDALSSWTSWVHLSAPAQPDSLEARQVTDTAVEISWLDAAFNETGFHLEVSESQGPWNFLDVVSADATHYRATGLTVGKDYQFRLRAYTQTSASDWVYGATLLTRAGRGYCATCQNGWGGPAAGDTGPSSPQTLGSGSTVEGTLAVPVGHPGLPGSPLGQGTLWTNQVSLQAGPTGTGVVVSTKPSLQKFADNSIRITNGASVFTFDLSSSGYVSRYSSWESLSHDTINHRYVMTDSQGNQTRFYDEDPSNSTNAYKLLDFTSTAGPTIQTSGSDETYQVNGTTIEKRTTTYTAGRVSSVALHRLVNGTLTLVRTIEYRYYGAGSPNGNEGDLESVQTYDATSTLLEETYYRYYKANEPNGYAHGLKFSFGTEACARLKAVLPTTYTSASDSAVAPYADEYFEYDDRRRVIKTVRAGSGRSDDYGRGTFTYVYLDRAVVDNYNTWKFKTIETLPGYNFANVTDPANTRTVYYANYAGQIMLKLTESPDGNGGWQDLQRVFYHYDEKGRVDFSASGAAITGYDETRDDLLNQQAGDYQYLSNDQGLVLWTYYDGSSGFASGHAEAQGESGDQILQDQTTYNSFMVNGQWIYRPTSTSVYSAKNQHNSPDPIEGERTTQYAYFVLGENTPDDLTDDYLVEKTTAPEVSSGHNGSGLPAVTWTYRDTAGRVTWTRDALGVLSYTGYDAAGNLVTTIQDYLTDATHPGPVNPDNPVTTFSTPAGYGLHLETQYTYEALGRLQTVTDPAGHVTYTLYNDAAHETRTYQGWHPIGTGSYTSTGPVVVSRTGYGSQDENGTLTGYSYQENLTLAAPIVSGAVPTGTESTAAPLSLSRTFYNAGGQRVETDSYYSFSGVTFSGLHPGSATSNYLRTQYTYDSRGCLARTVNPAGTIQRSVFDNLGQTLSTWVGTDDTVGAGLTWSPENNATGTSNLVQTSAFTYVDSLLVHQEQLRHVTGQPDLISDYQYDWRNRLVATRQGGSDAAHRPLTVQEYDNLGEVLGTFTYDGDTLTLGEFADGPKSGNTILEPASLRGYSRQAYNEQGRVYQSTVESLSYTGGVLNHTSLATSFSWYDANGRLLKTLAPNGLATKYQYDGAGRTVGVFQTDAGGDLGPGVAGTWDDAGTLAGDHVLQQTQQQYDPSGNVIFTITKERRYEATATEALADSDARVTYWAAYFDQAGRLMKSADYGTNNGTLLAGPPTPAPDRQTNGPLVTTYAYDDAGQLQTVTDPRNIATRTEYDALGRTLKTIAAYTDGTPTNASNQTIQNVYDSAGRLFQIVQVMPSGQNSRTTEYVYGVTTNGTFASAIHSNDLVSLVKYPDPATGHPSSLAQDQVRYAYDAQGQVLRQTTLTGATLTSSFDSVGRPVSQTTSAGSTSLTIQSGYDALGRLIAQTDARGHTTDYTYDALGRTLEVLQPDPGDASGRPATTYAYDPAGAYMEVTDPLGNITRSDYDLLGRVIRVTAPAPNGDPNELPITTYQYNVTGDRTLIVDPRGLLASGVVVDRFGRTLQERATDPAGQTPGSLTYSSLTQTATVHLAGHGYQVNDLVVVTEGDSPAGYAGVFVVTAATPDSFTYSLASDTSLPAVTSGATVYGTFARATYLYDADGNVTSVQDARDNTTTYDYDNLNRQITITQPEPETGVGQPVTSYLYDLANNRIQVTDALERVTTYAYDQRDRLISVTRPDPDGTGPQTAPVTTITYGFDAAGRSFTETADPLNQLMSSTFLDPFGRTVEERTMSLLPAPSSVVVNSTTVDIYLSESPYITMGDYFVVDGAQDLAYNGVYLLADCTEYLSYAPTPMPTGSSTGMRVLKLLSRQVYTYDNNGNVETSVNALGATTTYTYDHLDRLLTTELPAASGSGSGPQTAYNYDANGNVTSVTNAAGHTTEYQYDHLNRLRWVIGPDLNGQYGNNRIRTLYQYDLNGNLTGVVNPLGNVIGGDAAAYTTSYVYDALNRKIQEVLPAVPLPDNQVGSAETTYTYDAAGNLTSLTDPEDNTTAYTYDHLNRLSTETNQLSDVRSYTYDDVGNVLSITDRRGQVREFTYDALDRQIEERWVAGSLLTPTSITSSGVTATVHIAAGHGFAAGDLIRITGASQSEYNGLFAVEAATSTSITYTLASDPTVNSATGTLRVQELAHDFAFGYDGDDRLTTISEWIGGPGQATYNEYSYDYEAAGRNVTWDVSTRANLNNGETRFYISRRFDAAGRRSFMWASVNEAYLENYYTYDAQDHLRNLTQANGSVDWTYNDLGQVETITRTEENQTIGTTTYSYDLADRLTGLSHTVGSTTRSYNLELDIASQVYTLTTPEGTITYDHDASGQLISADGTNVDEDYTYDAAGNRVVPNDPDLVDNRLEHSGVYRYQYDAEGNRLQQDTYDEADPTLRLQETLYTWDYRNRLTGVTTWDCDVNGNPTGDPTVMIRYAYDPQDRRIQKTVSVPGTPVLQEHYLWDDDNLLMVVDDSADEVQRFLTGLETNEILAQSTAETGEMLWTLTDHLGSIRDVAQVTGGTASFTGHVVYDSFGNVTPTAAAQDLRMLYTGQQYDSETGLYYYHARYYDPANGIFISQDPLGFVAGDCNLNRYVRNDPLGLCDPNGKKIEIIEVSTASATLPDTLYYPYPDSAIAGNAPITTVPQTPPGFSKTILGLLQTIAKDQKLKLGKPHPLSTSPSSGSGMSAQPSGAVAYPVEYEEPIVYNPNNNLCLTDKAYWLNQVKQSLMNTSYGNTLIWSIMDSASVVRIISYNKPPRIFAVNRGAINDWYIIYNENFISSYWVPFLPYQKNDVYTKIGNVYEYKAGDLIWERLSGKGAAVLAHELIHSYYGLELSGRRVAEDTSIVKRVPDIAATSNEVQTVGAPTTKAPYTVHQPGTAITHPITENKIREELGLPLRMTYGGYTNKPK